MLRAVVDANVFASATHNPESPPAKVIHAWFRDRFQLILSPAILAEVRRVLHYPRIKKASTWTEVEVAELISLLETNAEIQVPGALDLKVVRDPTDDKYIVAAVEGQADYIVSGDKDLLDLGRYQSIAIVSPRRFLQILAAER
jgi:hypothetical protein